ncbi:tyrosine-type recombinase/integrase [Pelagibacterium lacus]|uniref:Integrase n=1 Tax=Pelagibacterium lacus TaxID=2282655 RepID=A0A369W6G9_9HYPH|nr:tyrosine-type recombinase/integrase [Pelagibacterium lacus]RDE07671.1 hypothetical protein DVH29_15540 [Pelagibacterium lacus]
MNNDWISSLTRLDGAYAPTTIRGYRSDFLNFSQWCASNALAALPAEVSTVCAYIDAHAGILKPSTLKRRLAAIRMIHSLLDLGDPTLSRDIKLALRRVMRQHPARPDQALGITAERRDKLLAACDTNLKGLRDQALVSVGFDTLCRRSELVALRIEDIEYDDDGTAKILVRRAKNDPVGQGRIAHLSSRSIKLIEDWQDAAAFEEGPLIRPVRGDIAYPRHMASIIVSRVLKELSAKANFDEDAVSSVSGHSLRVGAAQSLVKMGYGLLPIMAAGGWRSAEVVARYVAHVELNPWRD